MSYVFQRHLREFCEIVGENGTYAVLEILTLNGVRLRSVELSKRQAIGGSLNMPTL